MPSLPRFVQRTGYLFAYKLMWNFNTLTFKTKYANLPLLFHISQPATKFTAIFDNQYLQFK